ncbi:hypothetical protein OIDMADRAFT_147227 [Oidiodendron maius Zn]|uniref:Methylenetetrahydrofolate dehydrogenase [NAD(+)] n=1 Tax=Oidiodendron maius (strain Zn) TaxID=913774 RepID=A0A0C3H5H8_OIDMZ|nr:hypothetical protein OIDMADRAFT_147227 [Oidiodendron maius Zn]
MASATPATCKVVLAGTIAQGLLAEVKEGLAKLGSKPKLVGFLANGDPAAQVYAEYCEKTCNENGFEFSLRTVEKENIEQEIIDANADKSVHGIIVYYPIFPRTSGQDRYVQNLVGTEKDVEGLCHKYLFNMYQNIRFLDEQSTLKSILPCTPLAVIKVLEYLQIYNSILPYGNRLFGKTITVINRSEVVGRPLAALLANDGAKVYSVDLDGVDIFTRGQGIKAPRHAVHKQEGLELKDCLPLSDVVISGVPDPQYKVPIELVRDGAVCINFSSDRNFDTVAVKDKASIYVPAIGKVTIAVLLRNLLRLVHNGMIKEGTEKPVPKDS